jgi:hypothetical protein
MSLVSVHMQASNRRIENNHSSLVPTVLRSLTWTSGELIGNTPFHQTRRLQPRGRQNAWPAKSAIFNFLTSTLIDLEGADEAAGIPNPM